MISGVRVVSGVSGLPGVSGSNRAPLEVCDPSPTLFQKMKLTEECAVTLNQSGEGDGERARARCARLGGRTRFENRSIFQLGLSDATFDPVRRFSLVQNRYSGYLSTCH